MNPTQKKLLAAGICAVAAFTSAWFYFNSKEKDLLLRGELVEVVVAKRHIAAYTRIEAGMLILKDIPREYIPRGAVMDYRSIVGQLSLVPFNVEEPILYNKLAQESQALASAVPEGMRAFTIPVDKISGLNGMLRPGDLVDVFFMTEGGKAGSPQAFPLFQSVKILAAGSRFGEGDAEADSGGSVSLALSPGDCQLALFSLSRGVLHLALRPAGDSRHAALAPVDFNDVVSRGRQRTSAPAPALESPAEDFTPTKR